MIAEFQVQRSAGFQPAVSQVLNLLAGRSCKRIGELGYRHRHGRMPIENRRYSRLETCATFQATSLS